MCIWLQKALSFFYFQRWVTDPLEIGLQVSKSAFCTFHIVLIVNISRQDEEPGKVLKSLMAAQLQISPINKRKSSRLQVEVNYRLIHIYVQEQLASTKSHLDEVVRVKLG